MGLIDRRIGLLFGIFLGLLAIAGVRAAYFGAVKSGALKTAATSQQISTITVPAPRGTITDRHGVELAVSEPASDVAATPYLIKDPLRVATRIAPLLGQPRDAVLRKLSEKDTGFVYLARTLPDTRARRIEAMEIEGLQFTASSRRSYPQKQLAAQLIGFVQKDLLEGDVLLDRRPGKELEQVSGAVFRAAAQEQPRVYYCVCRK